MQVEIVPQVRAGEADVSSTRIRNALVAGDVAESARCLGRPYSVWGLVVRGDERGRTLGFPTLNLDPENELIPALGVYATTARFLDGEPQESDERPSVTNVGTRPTFEPGRVLVETHLIDCEGDFYGRRVAVSFHERMRAERRFQGPEALKEQIARDVEAARKHFRASAE
jgi:riboflavin kinase/FMN adenylyltransferase